MPNADQLTARPISVIMLAYGQEEYLDEAVRAVLDSTGVTAELIVIDNGCTSSAVAELPRDPRLQVVHNERNLGFTGGANLGASLATCESLFFVNSDALVAPDALSRLADALDDDGVGIVCAAVLLADQPDRVNSLGNPLHVLGLSWAGHMNEPFDSTIAPHNVASASGACLGVTRELWLRLGGFASAYFAYLEDLELSWRTHQLGLKVLVVPQAQCFHHYEFGRSPLKMYLVERNRLVFVLTCYQTRTRVLLFPVLLAFEFAMLAVAIAQHWGQKKVAGWRWLWRHRNWIRSRRHAVANQRILSDRQLAHLMTDRFDPAQIPLPPGSSVIQAALRGYWRLVRALL